MHDFRTDPHFIRCYVSAPDGINLHHQQKGALTMFAQPTKKHMNFLVSAAIVLTLAGVFVASRAFARIIGNTIDPVAIVTDNGRHIIARGPISCTEGQRAHLRATVTQRATGAVAEGRTLLTCTGNIQQWEVHASTQGKETFQEGPATAVAIATTTDRGNTDDAHQWLVNITLVGE
jgi:hypothetical protein